MDCDKLEGRYRTICRGYDDEGNPIDMPEEKRQKYIKHLQQKNNRRSRLGKPCQHLGSVTREITCNICPHETRNVPVFSCSLHGECTQLRVQPTEHTDALPACSTCLDYKT